jgi:hypothetical protein
VISKHTWHVVSSYRNPIYLHTFHVYQLFYNPIHHKRTTTTWLNSYFYHTLFHVWGFRPHYFGLAPSNSIKTLHTLLGLLRLQSLVYSFIRHAFHISSHIKMYDLHWLARSVIITYSYSFEEYDRSSMPTILSYILSAHTVTPYCFGHNSDTRQHELK